jgi:hypothetical protein
MEGNIAAYFHPRKELIAFLYPSGNINIYDSQSFENLKTTAVRNIKPNGEKRSNQELVAAADMSLAADGFDRAGRVTQAASASQH